MLIEKVTYEDFDGNEVTETLYFNLTKTELLLDDELSEALGKWEESFKDVDPEAYVTPEGIREIVKLTKLLILRAYGVRSEDGKKFIKSEKATEEFDGSLALDALLSSLLESNDPDRATNFIVGLLPKNMQENVQTVATDAAKHANVEIQMSNSNSATNGVPPEVVAQYIAQQQRQALR